MIANEVARSPGVSADVVCYYSRIGLLNPTPNPDNSYREHTPQDAIRVNFFGLKLAFEANGYEVELATDNSKTGQDAEASAQEIEHRTLMRKFWFAAVAVLFPQWFPEQALAEAFIHKLLTEQPAGIKGIAAPGMSLSSPGMESPKASKYKILSVDDKGEIEVYATREGQNAH